MTFADDGSFTYTPDADFNGSDSFTYEVTDGNGGTDVGVVSLTVNPINDDPTVDAGIGDQIAAENAPFNFTVPTNAFEDVDGDDLSLSTSTLPTWLSFDAATGTFTGTPANGDTNVTITVTATDGNGGVDATEVFTITITPANDAPVATDDTGSGNEDTAITGNVLANDADADNVLADLSATVVASPTNGTVVLLTDGSFTYTPNADFNGSDSFTYEVTDGNGGTDVGVVSLTVTPVNDAPVVDQGIADQSATEDVPFSFAVPTDAFDDVDGDALTLTTLALPAWLIVRRNNVHRYASSRQHRCHSDSYGRRRSPFS